MPAFPPEAPDRIAVAFLRTPKTHLSINAFVSFLLRVGSGKLHIGRRLHKLFEDLLPKSYPTGPSPLRASRRVPAVGNLLREQLIKKAQCCSGFRGSLALF